MPINSTFKEIDEKEAGSDASGKSQTMWARVKGEAENAVSHGRIVGPDRSFGTLAAEASGRRAVLLENARDFVEFTLAKSANALTVRFAVPDASAPLASCTLNQVQPPAPAPRP